MEILKNIHKIERRGFHTSNIYLITGQDLILIDTGMPGSAKDILSYISRLGLKPDDISTIVVTHFHIDHAGSLFEVKKHTNAKIAAHKEDADFIAGRRYPGALLRAISLPYKYNPVQVDIALDENDKLGNFIVLHTPGHTPGSICLYDPEGKALFTGDALTTLMGKIRGPSRLFTTDIQQAKSSIKKMSQLDFEVMLPGHGKPIKSTAAQMVKHFVASL
jgi:glyoxylase-like metal-dependent hydrolase (beta-lactamase superfamily II)